MKTAGAGSRAKPGSDLEHLVMRRVGHAIGDYRLTGAGDRILVAISGGRKSFVLLHMLDLHRRRFPYSFELIPLFIDVFSDRRGADEVAERYAERGFKVRVASRDIVGRIEQRPPAGRASSEQPCTACCRLRKQALAEEARALGCNKVASGETLDDFIEHLFYNMFFHGRLESIGVHLAADEQRPAEIRPLVNVESGLAAKLSDRLGWRPAPADCALAQTADPGRQAVREAIAWMTAAHPRARRSLLAAMKHLRPAYLLDPDALGDRAQGRAGP